MNDPAAISPQRPRFLNSVPLQNAVLCAQCDVVSDSPHDVCLVCGSRSLFNISRIFGGKLPTQRANVVMQEVVETSPRDVVLAFPKRHRLRRKATSTSRQFPVVGVDDSKGENVELGVLRGPHS
jgi:hypothetical protein